ncbi:hypothetical protein PPTG_22190 [Phytophthora nicotianae INRA-310]|uniref:Uncharacterized protein n=1 Tax=Phytophthora nicotianae (strain INRA-310) TaxID=761204 RepID=W2QP70_PHYN3|nr:hypothetical protein PPTG_22190 [Phytophthora nicotianae INRA-310]ETN14055.1 hypothetical protein PPTG_22190 [Phytophthora nicotianae INRA-310]
MVRVQFGAERSRSSGPGACDRGPGAVRNNTKSKLHRVAIFSNNVGTDWSYGLGSGGTGGGAALEKRTAIGTNEPQVMRAPMGDTTVE